MSRATPEEVFAEARAAMERGDWEGVCACMDADTLLRIAANGVARLSMGGEDLLAALCREHAVPEEMVATMRSRLQRLAESGRAAIAPEVRSDPGAMLEQSLRHKQIVDDYQKSLKAMLKAVPDLAGFTAALERRLRAESGGGSMSARLFVGETLEAVSITGTKAWATRRTAEGHPEDLGFVRRKGAWYLRPLARRPAAGRG